MPSSRTQYFREYYNNRIKNEEYYEKEKLRVAEYIKNRKLTDPEFNERLKEHRRQYRLRKKEEKKALAGLSPPHEQIDDVMEQSQSD